MTSITQLPDAVQWWEGMLLSPQHFQQNDIYWQQHLQHRMRCVAPHNWGVRHLRIDHAALANGNVNISELECLLPDGLAIAFPGSYAPQTLELNVKDLCKSDGKPIRIWLVVHERGASAAKFE
jgi:type VI secretion system protein ImpJ